MHIYYVRYTLLAGQEWNVICHSYKEMINHLWGILNDLYQRQVGFEWMQTMFQDWHDPNETDEDKREYRSKKNNVQKAIDYGILKIEWTDFSHDTKTVFTLPPYNHLY